jgi:hypothetical protein
VIGVSGSVCRSVCNGPLVVLFKVDCGEPRSIPPCVECRCSDCCEFRVGSVAHCNCFAEFVFGSLHSGVFVDNGIGAEGEKVLADALKDNTTLTSLSLNLYCELSCFVGGWCFWLLLLKCVLRSTGWTVQSGLWRAIHDQYNHVSSALGAIVAIAC